MGERDLGVGRVAESCLWIEARLRRRFAEEAVVTNKTKGYVSAEWVNQLIDLEMQGWAADMIVNDVRRSGQVFDVVVGIPNSGIPLANSVAERLRLPLAPGRKGGDCPGAWRMPIVIEEEAPSFTTGVRSTFVFNGMKEGDRVLAVEDVIAKGETMGLVVRELRKRGISVCRLAAYFAKLFQGGVARLEGMGVETFYVVGLSEMYEDEKGVCRARLAPPHFA